MKNIPLAIEIFKCAALMVIAVTLIGIYLRTPIPFTLKNIQEKNVAQNEIPLVHIRGGRIDADVSGRVEIDN